MPGRRQAAEACAALAQSGGYQDAALLVRLGGGEIGANHFERRRPRRAAASSPFSAAGRRCAPVAGLKDWLALAEITAAPLFRKGLPRSDREREAESGRGAPEPAQGRRLGRFERHAGRAGHPARAAYVVRDDGPSERGPGRGDHGAHRGRQLSLAPWRIQARIVSRSPTGSCFLPCGMRSCGLARQSSNHIRLLDSGSPGTIIVPYFVPVITPW